MAKKIKINSVNDKNVIKVYNHFSKIYSLMSKNKYIIVLLLLFFLLMIYILFYSPSIDKVKVSVVMIETYGYNGEKIGTGSGFCAFNKNYIVTNFHVIEGANSIKIITNDKKTYHATKVVIFDYENDLAILQTDTNFSPLKLGYAYEIKTGKKIKTIGSPMGEINTLSTGIISNADNDSGIQISAPISHGSSGGVLLDGRNRVIGITYAGYDNGENLNFAINVKFLKQLYNSYKKGEYKKISTISSGNSINYSTCYSYANDDLRFKGCNSYGNNKELYSIDSLDILFNITNSFLIYDSMNSINSLYESLSLSERKIASELYLEINDNASVNNDELSNMNIVDLIYAISKEEKNSLSKSYLANAVVSLKDIENNTKCFNKVNSMSLSVEGKRLLLLGICPSYTPSNLSDSDAKGFIGDIDGLNLSVNQKSIILKRFGYKVNDGRVYW